MMNTMSNNKLNIEELETVTGGEFWDALARTISKTVKTSADALAQEFEWAAPLVWRYLEDHAIPAVDPSYKPLRPYIIF